jgi:hypothetical protein
MDINRLIKGLCCGMKVTGRGPATAAVVHHLLVCLGLLADKVVS